MVGIQSEGIVASDLPKFHEALNSLQSHLSESITGVELLQSLIKENPGREKGISFLEMKCHLFLEYLINITYTMLLKLEGQPIAGEQCIERLVEIRTILTKIKPIEKKLKYQIDKLLKVNSGEHKGGEQNALSFKPNIENLLGKDEEESDNEEDDDEEEKKQVYVPPKLTAVHYDGDKQSKEEKKLEKARKRTLNTNLLSDMREEFGNEPEEIKEMTSRGMQKRLRMQVDERENFEEDNLRRLTLTKKDKQINRKLGMLDEIVKIGNFNMDNDGSSDDEPDLKSKVKRGGKQGKNKGKGKFKKRMQRKK